jgi:hypothetical protein
VVINVGSIEAVIVRVTDQEGELTALPSGTTFDIIGENLTYSLLNQVATVDGMEAACIVNATALAEGDYNLFLKFPHGGQTPKLGPHRFRVSAV